ncbi:MAG: porin [Sneathiella sp.]
MKKVILGTTALVAASALTVGSASAAEKIKLNVGGYMQTSFVVADYDTDTGQLPTDVRHEGEVHFTGSTVLDNGLKFGVNIQLEARATGDQVDETFIFVEGAFGRVNIGSENAASYLMHYSSPSPVIGWTLNDSNANASGFGTPATSATEVSDADKITYFTPRFSGFQLGASYTPDGDEETGTGASPYAPLKDEGAADEAYSIGVNYIGKVAGVSVKASAGYDLITRSGVDTATVTAATTTATHSFTDGTNTLTNTYVNGALTSASVTGTATVVGAVTSVAVSTTVAAATTTTTSDSTEDTDEFSVGLNLGFEGFVVGAAYKYTDNNDGNDDEERHDYNVGVTYGQGPWTVGVQYAGVELDGAGNGNLDAVVIGGKYILGPGVTAFGGVQYWQGEDDLVGSEGDDATVFFVGTALSF